VKSTSADRESAGLCRPRRVYVVSVGRVASSAKRYVCDVNLKLGTLV
jgi:hypothetical protein